MIIHLQNKSMGKLWHGLQENKSPCGTASTSWLCFWGDPLGSIAQGPPPLRGHATRGPWSTATWIRGYQLWQPSAGKVTASSMSRSHPTPAVSWPEPPIISCLSFLYVYDPYYYWICILLSHRSLDCTIYLFMVALILALKDIHHLGMGGKWSGGEWMLPWVPGNGSVENFKLCQAKQEFSPVPGKPGELQRQTKSKEALKLPGEDKGNLLKTLKWHFRFLSVLSHEPNWVLLPDVKVITNRRFHLAPQKGWRLLASQPCSESHMASQHCTVQQLPKATQSHFWLFTWTLWFIYSSASQEGLHIHQNIFICHRFQVSLDAVLV